MADAPDADRDTETRNEEGPARARAKGAKSRYLGEDAPLAERLDDAEASDATGGGPGRPGGDETAMADAGPSEDADEASESDDAPPGAQSAKADPEQEPEKRRAPPLKKWGWALPFVVAAFEFIAHAWQTHDVVPESDWIDAKARVAEMAKPDDGIVFSPDWTEPLGRRSLGALITPKRAGYASIDRFPRIVEVSQRGGRLEATRGWRITETRSAGRLAVRVLENPSFTKILDELVGKVKPGTLDVSPLNDPDAHCEWTTGPAQAGGLGYGPALPRERVVCPGSAVALSTIEDLSYRPRYCILAPPTAPGGGLRLVFHDVRFGQAIAGHHGLYAEAERARQGAPVKLAFASGTHRFGDVAHIDGDGWKGFELPTSELAGKVADLEVSVSTENPNLRSYCFEAVTR